jgi:hypothetical protein
VIQIIGDPIIFVFHPSGMKKRKCFEINTSIIVQRKHSGMVLMALRSNGMLIYIYEYIQGSRWGGVAFRFFFKWLKSIPLLLSTISTIPECFLCTTIDVLISKHFLFFMPLE